MKRRKFIQFFATAAVAAHLSFKSLVPVPKMVEVDPEPEGPWNGLACNTMSVSGSLFANGDHVMIDRELMRVTYYDARRGMLKVERG